MKLGKFELDKIYCGDCEKLIKSIPDNTIDLIVTSPPYNKHSAKRKCGKTDSWQRANIDYGKFNDSMPEQKYQEWQKRILRECVRVLKPSGSIFYNHKPRIINHKILFPHEWLGDFIVRQMIIWNRLNSPVLEPIRFMPIVEYIFWITKERKTPKFNKEAFIYKEIWEIPPSRNKEHPATFPEKLVRRCILSTTFKDDIILDPFMGIGTVGKIARELKRHFLGFDINPEYIKIANRNLEQVQVSML